jgi:hypothetical protein
LRKNLVIVTKQICADQYNFFGSISGINTVSISLLDDENTQFSKRSGSQIWDMDEVRKNRNMSHPTPKMCLRFSLVLAQSVTRQIYKLDSRRTSVGFRGRQKFS